MMKVKVPLFVSNRRFFSQTKPIMIIKIIHHPTQTRCSHAILCTCKKLTFIPCALRNPPASVLSSPSAHLPTR